MTFLVVRCYETLLRDNYVKIRGAIVLAKTSGTEHLIRRPIYPLECDKKDDEDVNLRFLHDAYLKMMQKIDT